jgi:GMP synthase-like glutamine amidotransferase
MRLLYLQNGPRRASVSGLEHRLAEAGFDVDLVWAWNGEAPRGPEAYDACFVSGSPHSAYERGPEAYDACFVSGSPHSAYEDIPWIHREHEWLQALAERGVPMLGICFGSQILGSALCGRDQVLRRTSCEVGYVDLAVKPAAKADPVAGELGETVHIFVWHNDEVRAGHPDMVILADSPDCPNHICKHRRYPAWGIQGHPEVSAEQARGWFETSRARLEADGADVAALQRAAEDVPEADTMLRRFIAVARRDAAA